MNRHKTHLALALYASIFFTLTACAKEPDKIAAADIGPNPYVGLSCRQLAVEELKVMQALENLRAKQKDAASGDALGVFLIGIPLSSMSGNDQETAIAVAKGRLQAIDVMQQKRGCA